MGVPEEGIDAGFSSWFSIIHFGPGLLTLLLDVSLNTYSLSFREVSKCLIKSAHTVYFLFDLYISYSFLKFRKGAKL